jgi:RNA-directed DNA polymerase
MFGPIIRGWIQYYGRFYKWELYNVLRYMDKQLVRWAERKHKKLAGHTHWLGQVARRQPHLFPHWQMGVRPAAG